MTLRFREIEQAAQRLGVTVRPLGVREPDDFAQAFTAMDRERPDAMFLVTDALTLLNRRRVLEYVEAKRIPAMFEYGFLVRDGGLLSYGADQDALYRRAAWYVDRIVKGARPAQLAIEQPTRLLLVVNVRTPRPLGHAFAALARARGRSGAIAPRYTARVALLPPSTTPRGPRARAVFGHPQDPQHRLHQQFLARARARLPGAAPHVERGEGSDGAGRARPADQGTRLPQCR
jgi:hypothetical protein